MFHFAARNAMNIEGLGEKVIMQLLEEGIIEDPADLLMLRSEDLMSLPLFKEKKTENTLQSIEKSKKVTLDHLIFALGIRYLGEQGSAEIANYFLGDKKAYSLENLAEDGGKITIEQLSNLEGIGPKVAEAVYGFFHHPKNIELIRKLQQAGVEIQVHEIGSTSAIFGKSFVLTGGLTSMSRDEAKEKIKKLGGKIHSGVTRDTNFVIVGQDAGSKAKKADELGIQKLSEEEFLEMLAA
jgi:DNA ligase (NAD+)